ncbi:MFS transporter [Streptacidiphilus melanogenes]|uniref:MFS transporter n=1 Tax=Streptacidiphilus melanogenes TaxID=411235 RepID=UPI001F23EC5D|nr:MFS transporter [Streptacidiphilus melanogenes]
MADQTPSPDRIRPLWSARRSRYRGLVGLLLTQALSLTGTRVSAVALPWLVLTTTGSTALTGLTAFCELGPYVLAKAAAGPAIDRIGPRRISLLGDLVSATAVLAVPIAHAAGALPIWLLLVLVAVIGSVRGPGDAAKVAMTPDAADDARVPLERVTGLSGAAERLAITAGPALGAAAVAGFGAATALVFNAATFLLSGAATALAAPQRRVQEAAAEEDAGYWERLGKGFAFLRGNRLLATAVGLTVATNFLDAAWSAVLIPVWVHRHGLGVGAVGAVFSVMSAASAAAGLVAAWLGERLPRRVTFLAGFVVAGAPRFLVLALGAPLGAVLAVSAVSGFAAGFLNPILAAAVYERIPRELVGRVISVADAVSWAGVPLGGLIAGAALGAVALGPVAATAGLLYCAVTTLTGLRPEWRELDAEPAARTDSHPSRAPSHRPLPGASPASS